MAFEQLFIRTQKSLAGVELDAVISETHNNNISLTKNPVELGTDITDHAIIEPKKISIVAQVSDTPLGTAALGEIVDSVTGFFGTSTSQNLTRSTAAYNAIKEIVEQREPIEVQTKLVLYTNMLITSLNITQDKDSSRVALMNITLEEVLITSSEIIQFDPDDLLEGQVREQASSAQKRGRQEAKAANDAVSKSALKSIVGWIKG
jgi:hypothetical protein